MNEQIDNGAPAPGGNAINEGIGRVWSEIKQISKQVERETRRTGRVARLKLDLRSLHREEQEVSARLGKAVYAALKAHGAGIALSEVEALAGGVAALDALTAKIAAKEAEVDALHAPDAAKEAPLTESEEVA